MSDASRGRNEANRQKVEASLAARYRREKRFRLYGALAVSLGLVFVGTLFVSIIGNGYKAFGQTHVRLEIYLDPQIIDPAGSGDPAVIGNANYDQLVRVALREIFPDVTDRRGRRSLNGLMSSGAGYFLRDQLLADPGLIGQRKEYWLPADDDVDMLIKGYVDRELPRNRDA